MPTLLEEKLRCLRQMETIYEEQNNKEEELQIIRTEIQSILKEVKK